MRQNCLDILREKNIDIYAPCGGKGICGKCKVKIIGDTSELTQEERNLLTANEIKDGVRLACKTEVFSYDKIIVLKKDLINNSKEKIKDEKYKVNSNIRKEIAILEKPTLENGYSMSEIFKKATNQDIKIELEVLKEFSKNPIYEKEITLILNEKRIIGFKENKSTELYGIAIDIGTTTIACYLVDMIEGKIVDVISFQNPQYIYGSDLITRLNYIENNENGLKILNQVLIESLDKNFEQLIMKNNINKKDLCKCVLTGNSVMTHILLEINTSSLSKVPFNIVIKDTFIEKAQYFKFKSLPSNAEIIIFPNIGGFVGGDTLAAMIATAYLEDNKTKLLLDLGTNGEITLFFNNKIYVCSAAAGPAFEGANIQCGMQAFSGAINKVKLKDDISYEVLGNKKPVGICGSGIIDLISILLQNEIIKTSGKFNNKDKIKNKNLAARLTEVDGKKVFVIASEEETENREKIVITQKDIREIQLAKGAIRAGINILLKKCNLKKENVDIFYLAGTFGNYIDKENSLIIGLLPEGYREKIQIVGNAAGKGCIKVLCDYNLNKTLDTYIEKSTHIEISNHEEFQNEFLKEMSF